MWLLLKRIKGREKVIIPKQAHINDAGYDVYLDEDCKIQHGKNKINLGFRMKLPAGTCAAISPRSSFMDVLGNSFVPIDADYSGDWNFAFNNFGEEIEIKAGERIGQIVFLPILNPNITDDEEWYNENIRGDGGFGSTGK